MAATSRGQAGQEEAVVETWVQEDQLRSLMLLFWLFVKEEGKEEVGWEVRQEEKMAFCFW